MNQPSKIPHNAESRSVGLMDSSIESLCPTCQIEATIIVKRRDQYRYFRCRKCELVFASPKPTISELTSYYSGFSFRQPEPQQVKRLHISITRKAKQIIFDAITYSSSPICSVLDFGGGVGFFANAFREYIPDVTLFEVDPKACAFAHETYTDRFKIINQSISLPLNFDRQFDLVFANQVIEHFSNLDRFFDTIRPVCHSNTVIIIVTPNNQTIEHLVRPEIFFKYVTSVSGNSAIRMLSASKQLLNDSWMCCDPPRHIYALSTKSMRACLEKGGFEMCGSKVQYTNYTHYSENNYSKLKFGDLANILRTGLGLMSSALMHGCRLVDQKNKYGGDLITFAKLK